MVTRSCLSLLLLLAAGCASTPERASSSGLAAPGFKPRALRAGETGVALQCSKIFAMDEHDHIFAPGTVLVRNGKIEYVGPRRAAPAGYEVHAFEQGWALPGMVDLHSHVQGTFDINDMVLPINAELRASPAYVPGNTSLDRARAAGVTTLLGIPGSGTSISGFGVLHKTKDTPLYDTAVIADPGAMKVAQSYNPERSADFGSTRAGLGWLLREANERAIAANEAGVVDPRLENLQKVHARELPVLIHCAGSDGVGKAVNMWKGEYDTRCVVSHGCFDAFKIAPYVVRMQVPMNHGPRTIDFRVSREGRFVGTAGEYLEAGARDFSLNTDAPVVPQEELFLQGTVSARYGADSYSMLRGLTIHPARSIGLGDRLGSLEPGKDADIGVFNGDPIDPRTRCELVLIDGVVEYSRTRDGQLF
ncbi:MAG: amidohydrolase family protein [Planctomycetes bacterium]|nr:amidohydrolase family protein [Planctomycetota bacterium]